MPFNQEVISFFETVSKYYGSKTEIAAGITSGIAKDAVKESTWHLSEFILLRSAYRTEGNKFMLEGKKIYYEISASNLVSFEQKGRHKFEFIEQYSETVFRITKIRFHYKY